MSVAEPASARHELRHVAIGAADVFEDVLSRTHVRQRAVLAEASLGRLQRGVEDLESGDRTDADLVDDTVAVGIDARTDGLDRLDPEVEAQGIDVEAAHRGKRSLAAERPHDEIGVDPLDAGDVEATVLEDDASERDAVRPKRQRDTRLRRGMRGEGLKVLRHLVRQ